MDPDESRRIVLEALLDVAPDIDEAQLDPQSSLRDSAELDSMDFVAFVAALSETLGADIPEDDYGQLDSVALATDYVVNRG